MRLIIVEDEILLALAMELSLLDLGHDVVAIADSEQMAVVSTLRLQPDAVLMDINLQEYGCGLKAAAQIRLSSSVPIIFCSGYSETASLCEEVAHLKNTAFFSKPLEEQKLAEYLNSLEATSIHWRPRDPVLASFENLLGRAIVCPSFPEIQR